MLPIQDANIKRRGFRFFIRARLITGRLEGEGFRLIPKTATGWTWSVLLFAAQSAR